MMKPRRNEEHEESQSSLGLLRALRLFVVKVFVPSLLCFDLGETAMRRRQWHLAILLSALLGAYSAGLQAQSLHATATQVKEVAITIDDLPLNGSQFGIERLRAMTDKLLAAINKHQIPVVGFVNESLLYRPGETDARIALLQVWADGGGELGSHTFSHLGGKDASLAAYADDFIRGDAV